MSHSKCLNKMSHSKYLKIVPFDKLSHSKYLKNISFNKMSHKRLTQNVTKMSHSKCFIKNVSKNVSFNKMSHSKYLKKYLIQQNVSLNMSHSKYLKKCLKNVSKMYHSTKCLTQNISCNKMSQKLPHTERHIQDVSKKCLKFKTYSILSS